MAEFLIPRTVPKFAGAPVNALDSDDLRYLLRHARCDRRLAVAVEQELRRRIPWPRPAGHERLSTYQPLFRRSRWRHRAIRPPAARRAGRPMAGDPAPRALTNLLNSNQLG